VTAAGINRLLLSLLLLLLPARPNLRLLLLLLLQGRWGWWGRRRLLLLWRWGWRRWRGLLRLLCLLLLLQLLLLLLLRVLCLLMLMLLESRGRPMPLLLLLVSRGPLPFLLPFLLLLLPFLLLLLLLRLSSSTGMGVWAPAGPADRPRRHQRACSGGAQAPSMPYRTLFRLVVLLLLLVMPVPTVCRPPAVAPVLRGPPVPLPVPMIPVIRAPVALPVPAALVPVPVLPIVWRHVVRAGPVWGAPVRWPICPVVRSPEVPVVGAHRPAVWAVIRPVVEGAAVWLVTMAPVVCRVAPVLRMVTVLVRPAVVAPAVAGGLPPADIMTQGRRNSSNMRAPLGACYANALLKHAGFNAFFFVRVVWCCKTLHIMRQHSMPCHIRVEHAAHLHTRQRHQNYTLYTHVAHAGVTQH